MGKSEAMAEKENMVKVPARLTAMSLPRVLAQQTFFDVTKYGGVGDGITENVKAFTDAWTVACQNNGGGVVLFPPGVYLLSPLVLNGKCKGPIGVQIEGTLLARVEKEYSVDIDHWITFKYVDNFVINGGGSLNGQGPSAWPYNDCKKNPHCKRLPGSLRLDYVTNARINHITSINSKNFHIGLFASHDITISSINISAPANSPNTDGIHLGLSQNIQILDAAIATGDDCISFSTGTNNVNISGVQCGPGHGISIGSLGKIVGDNVSFVDIRNCTFFGTQNGVRIKTWAPSEPGIVSHITFEQIQVDQVENPVIIDQQYCPSRTCDPEVYSRVQIEEVQFSNIWGTSITQNVVNLKCSKTTPCQKIGLNDINVTYSGREGPAKSTCSNAHVRISGRQNPPACTGKDKALG
ncbi:unnamed protein product [Malus baccata var. baccata]